MLPLIYAKHWAEFQTIWIFVSFFWIVYDIIHVTAIETSLTLRNEVCGKIVVKLSHVDLFVADKKIAAAAAMRARPSMAFPDKPPANNISPATPSAE